MTNEQQAGCPKNGCVSELPADPRALGWALTDETGWWCPLHSGGERYRLAQQRAEVDWYDGMIRVRHERIGRKEADREDVAQFARRNNLNRRDPEVRKLLARVDHLVQLDERELLTLQENRADVVARQELENESYRLRVKGSEDFPEN